MSRLNEESQLPVKPTKSPINLIRIENQSKSMMLMFLIWKQKEVQSHLKKKELHKNLKMKKRQRNPKKVCKRKRPKMYWPIRREAHTSHQQDCEQCKSPFQTKIQLVSFEFYNDEIVIIKNISITTFQHIKEFLGKPWKSQFMVLLTRSMCQIFRWYVENYFRKILFVVEVFWLVQSYKHKEHRQLLQMFMPPWLLSSIPR